MGCFGLGVTRIIAAAVEREGEFTSLDLYQLKGHCLGGVDEDGLVWTQPMAPFRLCVISAGEKVDGVLEHVLRCLPTEVLSDTIIDDRKDRNISIGVKMREALLAGFPYTMIIGKEAVASGRVELLERRAVRSARCSLVEGNTSSGAGYKD